MRTRHPTMAHIRAGAMTIIMITAAIGGGGEVHAATPDPAFDPITAVARLGEPVTFRTTLLSEIAPERIELLTRLRTEPGTSVQEAVVSEAGGAFDAVIELDGHVTPNTTLLARFRAVFADGATVEGPEASVTVVDDRFEWRTLEGPRVRLHWYEGDERFAQRALDIGEDAVERASELLGVTETDPVDFFIYASEGAFREALGPGTRENVGGQANASIRTLFGLIEPTDIGSDWVDVLVTHELTHLVFGTAVRNPYHHPPRWLNEGLAVYLSEGYDAGDRTLVEGAAASGELMPLGALGGLFPTTRARFNLAYSESVSAVDHFIATHGEPKLVQLIRSYAEGVTDDEAFTDATGADLAAFDASWVASLGGEIPEPFGPQPAPVGPVPPGWNGEAPAPSAALPSAGAPSVPPSATAALSPVPSPVVGGPSQSPSGSTESSDLAGRLAAWALPLAVAAAVIVIAVGLVVVLRRRRT